MLKNCAVLRLGREKVNIRTFGTSQKEGDVITLG